MLASSIVSAVLCKCCSCVTGSAEISTPDDEGGLRQSSGDRALELPDPDNLQKIILPDFHSSESEI